MHAIKAIKTHIAVKILIILLILEETWWKLPLLYLYTFQNNDKLCAKKHQIYWRDGLFALHLKEMGFTFTQFRPKKQFSIFGKGF